MKKYLFLLCLSVSILLISCNRDVRTFTGDYSYKLSGNVMFTDVDGNVDHSIHSQRGQLNVLRDRNGEKDHVVITVNQMDGTVYSFSATVKGDSLILDDHDCVMGFSNVSSNTSLTQVLRPYNVHISGRGILHDNILVLEECWQGTGVEDNGNTLISTKITVLAEQND